LASTISICTDLFDEATDSIEDRSAILETSRKEATTVWQQYLHFEPSPSMLSSADQFMMLFGVRKNADDSVCDAIILRTGGCEPGKRWLAKKGKRARR
jgi:hypothetical protein